MGYAAAAEAMMRRRLLEDIYDRMTDDEKRLFVQMTMQNRSTEEIMRQLKINEQHLEQLVEHANKDRWYIAFGSDVAANVLTTGAAWLLGRILK
jgi:sialic acid synthase SpsE